MVRFVRTGLLRMVTVRKTAVALASALVLVGAASRPVAAAELLDRVLAVVANQIITLTDVTAARELGLETAGNAADPVRAILTRLIDRELVLDEVERYAPPEPAPEAIERAVAAVRARFTSGEAFEAALARSGLDEQFVRNAVRENLRIDAYETQRFPRDNPRRQALVDEWIAGLRRRGNVIDLYLVTSPLPR